MRVFLLLAASLVVSCAPPESATLELTHAFPALALAAGDEVVGICQSWTLHNEEDLYVRAVETRAGPGWHHSNWMFVPQAHFREPDGTFRCADQHFDEVSAELAGGSVLFAQSTQSTGETQRFPEGSAIRVPAHSRVIGSIHVLDVGPDAFETSLEMTLVPAEASDVRVVLAPLLVDDRAIDLAPRSETRVTTACDVPMRGDRTLYYVLPHFHRLATSLSVTLEGGARDGEVVFETSASIGHGLGGTLDPPFAMGDARGLRVTCTYRNESSERVAYGQGASDEMCSILAYTAMDVAVGGFAMVPTVTEEGGTTTLDAPCTVFTH